MSLRQQRRDTGDVRRGEARPVEDRELVAGELRERRREDLCPGAVTSGLSACPKGVRPDEVKLVGTPAQVVGTSVMSRLKRTLTAPPLPAAAVRILEPSRSETVPPDSAVMKGNVGSPGRFSAMTMPIAPAARAFEAFVPYGQPPRLTSAIAPLIDPPGAASQS